VLQIELGDNYIVILAGRRPGAVPQRPMWREGLRRSVEEAKIHLPPETRSLLVGLRHEEVVALYPSTGRGTLDPVIDQATRFAEAIAVEGFAVGIGGWHEGPRGVAVGYQEAKEALEIALRSNVPRLPVVFEDMLLEHVLSSTPRRERLLEDAIVPLPRVRPEPWQRVGSDSAKLHRFGFQPY
jgi:sugar diacid utilization regulator